MSVDEQCVKRLLAGLIEASTLSHGNESQRSRRPAHRAVRPAFRAHRIRTLFHPSCDSSGSGWNLGSLKVRISSKSAAFSEDERVISSEAEVAPPPTNPVDKGIRGGAIARWNPSCCFGDAKGGNPVTWALRRSAHLGGERSTPAENRPDPGDRKSGHRDSLRNWFSRRRRRTDWRGASHERKFICLQRWECCCCPSCR